MRRLHARLAAACVLAVATAAFTSGAAFAGGGHGDHGSSGGHDSSGGHSQQQSSGYSGHDDHGDSGWQQPQQQPQQQQSSGDSRHGDHGSQQQPQQQQQQQPTTTQAQEQGVKPSSTTSHWTKTHVGDSPDVSKRYGNGKTAAQIAKSKGAPDSAELTGPGNSQPHKITDCRHKSNRSGGVDVHAYKGSSSCESSQKPVAQKPAEQKRATDSAEVVGYCHRVGNKWVYATTTKDKLAEIVQHEDVIAPSFSYQGKWHSRHWDTAGRSIYNRCRHGETVSVQPTTTPTVEAEHKVTLCHATGSSTNPYVMITVDYHALKNGHTAAKGDIVPPTTINGVTYSANWDSSGQAIFNNGCKPVVAAQAPAPTTTTVTTTTTTAQTTTQAEAPVTTTATVPATTTATVTTTTPVTVTNSVAATTTTTVPQLTPVTETTTASNVAPSNGGVLGAQTSLAAPKKPSGGVLGTVGNVAGSTLPFTGFPVWLAVLVAFALILAGIALRRRTLGTRL
jgi:hypothetical protein